MNNHSYKFTVYGHRLAMSPMVRYRLEVDIANPFTNRPSDDVDSNSKEFNISQAIMHSIGLAEYIRQNSDGNAIEFNSFCIDENKSLAMKPEAKRSKYYFYNQMVARIDRAIHKALNSDYSISSNNFMFNVSVEFDSESKKLSDSKVEIKQIA